MSQNRFYKPILGLLAILLLFGSSTVQKSLNQDRREMGLVRVDNPLENAPPVLAFTTVALGGFRGLIANILWIRAADLQQNSKYFEMVQLADWITKLQPSFGAVWMHQAWNMAYNISIKFPEQHDRWLWVKRGIELLRDEGIRYNPHDPLLYRELAWFFQHKIGANLDDGHHYYKLVWAYEMSQVLGNGPVDLDTLINPKTDADKERVRKLREDYKMDPVVMKQADEKYGPLDWRLAESQGIYWGVKGMEKCSKAEDLMPLRRIIYQCMQLAFQRGRLVINQSDGRAEFTANVDIIPNVNRTYEEMIIEEPNVENLKNGHGNFVLQAVYTLYMFNREAEAAKWWKYLGEKYPYKTDMYPSINAFVVDRATGGAKREELNQQAMRDTIDGYIMRGYYLLAIGEEQPAYGHFLLAEKIRDVYVERISVTAQAKERLELPTMARIKQDALIRVTDRERSGWSDNLLRQLYTRLQLEMPTNLTTLTNQAPILAPDSKNVKPVIEYTDKNKLKEEKEKKK